MGTRDRLSSLAIKRHTLGATWNALHEPVSAGTDWGLTFPSEVYCKLFDAAFPGLDKNPWKAGAKGLRATYLRGTSDTELEAVRTFIDDLRPLVVLSDLTDASVALAIRAATTGAGPPNLTELGRLIQVAKPYGKVASEENRIAATKLARRLCQFVASMPIYESVDGVVAVPPSDPESAFSLPRGFAFALARSMGKANLSEAVVKAKATPQLKNLAKGDKVEALIGSVTVDAAKIMGKTILVVDDLYQSGLTLNYIAEELRVAGAKVVFGLAAVKTLSNNDNIPKPPKEEAGTTSPSTRDDDDIILF